MERIADSPEDVLAISENIDATHIPSLPVVIVYSTIALFQILFLPFMLILDPPANPSWHDYAFLGMVFALFTFAAALTLVSACSTYSVDSSGFSQRSPIGIGTWHLPPGDVAAVDLRNFAWGWDLIIVSINGKRRRIPLFTNLGEEFANRFPIIRS